jgi:hypothetical protein
MMDLAMGGILLVCFGLMKLFTDWCGRQVEVKSGKEQ